MPDIGLVAGTGDYHLRQGVAPDSSRGIGRFHGITGRSPVRYGGGYQECSRHENIFSKHIKMNVSCKYTAEERKGGIIFTENITNFTYIRLRRIYCGASV